MERLRVLLSHFWITANQIAWNQQEGQKEGNLCPVHNLMHRAHIERVKWVPKSNMGDDSKLTGLCATVWNLPWFRAHYTFQSHMQTQYFGIWIFVSVFLI